MDFNWGVFWAIIAAMVVRWSIGTADEIVSRIMSALNIVRKEKRA